MTLLQTEDFLRFLNLLKKSQSLSDYFVASYVVKENRRNSDLT